MAKKIEKKAAESKPTKTDSKPKTNESEANSNENKPNTNDSKAKTSDTKSKGKGAAMFDYDHLTNSILNQRTNAQVERGLEELKGNSDKKPEQSNAENADEKPAEAAVTPSKVVDDAPDEKPKETPAPARKKHTEPKLADVSGACRGVQSPVPIDVYKRLKDYVIDHRQWSLQKIGSAAIVEWAEKYLPKNER